MDPHFPLLVIGTLMIYNGFLNLKISIDSFLMDVVFSLAVLSSTVGMLVLQSVILTMNIM